MAPFLSIIGSWFALSTLLSSPSTSSQAMSTSPPPLSTAAGNAKNLMIEESWKSSMSPTAAREYFTTRSTWLEVTPDCKNGFITDEESKTGEVGAWSLTSEAGTNILIRNTIQGDDYLSYNVKVKSEDNLEFTFDIEYHLARDGTIRRTAYDIETIGMKSKILKPLIRGGLIGMIQEENDKLKVFMNN
mmetsp:Transcript_36664/g.76942  ORF Transcript_36664/g.76942 Transcript_36664/m.76942 type:complete len:188 (-) Transcript_36664:104-667(-)